MLPVKQSVEEEEAYCVFWNISSKQRKCVSYLDRTPPVVVCSGTNRTAEVALCIPSSCIRILDKHAEGKIKNNPAKERLAGYLRTSLCTRCIHVISRRWRGRGP